MQSIRAYETTDIIMQVHIQCNIYHIFLGAKEEDLSCSDSQASDDDNDEESPDEYAVNDREVDAIMEEAAAVFTDVFAPAPSTAEMILFPVLDEGGSSAEEESDWIVGSEDSWEEIEDMTTVLAQLRKPAQPIVYHFEAGCRETEQYIIEGGEEEEESDDLMEISLPLHEILLESGARGRRDGESGREEEGEGERVGKDGACSSAAAKLRKLLPSVEDKLETTDSKGELYREYMCIYMYNMYM